MLTIAFRDPANSDQAFANMQPRIVIDDWAAWNKDTSRLQMGIEGDRTISHSQRLHTDRLFAVRKMSATFSCTYKRRNTRFAVPIRSAA